MEFPVYQLKGFIQRIMERYVNVYTVFAMRRVCKKWRQISLKTQRPWLVAFDWTNEIETNARKLLKTVPVATQVLQKKLRRALKRRMASQNSLLQQKRHYEVSLTMTKHLVEEVNHELIVAQTLLEQYPTIRKKQRIHVDISME